MHKKDPKVVVIGGGTGQSIFLRGLKKYTENITAVVTVSDDGGGSGVLREDLGMLPPGDIRNCIMALADVEPSMKQVMQYRFEEGYLKGQSFGNLFLAALNGVYKNFDLAVSKISEILAVKGTVLPVSIDNMDLKATMEDSSVVVGETTIVKTSIEKHLKIEKLELTPSGAKPLSEVIDAIESADIIIMGPGSLYTSVIPNLIVDGVAKAIYESKASKVYIGNIMTQPGETTGYSVYDHVSAILDHAGMKIIDKVFVNVGVIDEQTSDRYQKEESQLIYMNDEEENEIQKIGIDIIKGDFIEIKKGYVRHDSAKLAKIILENE